MLRPLIVRSALNGYIVEAGCQTVVFDSKDRLLLELKRYLDNPAGVEKEFLEKAVNKSMNTVPEVAAPGTFQTRSDGNRRY